MRRRDFFKVAAGALTGGELLRTLINSEPAKKDNFNHEAWEKVRRQYLEYSEAKKRQIWDEHCQRMEEMLWDAHQK